jgi:Domain of unknown function (DUF4062)/NACHT domain
VGVVKTGSVFISHTSDMARFPNNRSFVQAALDAVARSGMTPVDMRYFAARDGQPAEYCRMRLRECEIYVAVVGFHYGSMVPGEAVSYIEMEFQAASAAGLPRLVFLQEETADSPIGLADLDRGPVEGFRQRLRDAGLVVRAFTSDAGLELEMFHALCELTGGRPSAAFGELPAAATHLAAGQSPEFRDEVIKYLQTLIDWVNIDLWPRDRRFGGPTLTPASIERKLRVSAPGRAGEEDLGADDLAQACQRLVVLGGPGSGKTWLAKRTTRRCAEHALHELAAGALLNEVELPLYTTCSRLFSTSGDIRAAAVSSALDQLGDLDGARPSAALRTFLAERNAPTLLVIDSLDEAHGSHERLRQADTLPWRVVLTSRPSSWNQQLAINDTDDSHRVGELQPLRYPDDVEPFIQRWFADQPQRGRDLAAQIRRRTGLQQAATVPLVLAFYCIVGGREPLPDFRRDLYDRVLNRLLTGRWRGDEDRHPDVGPCIEVLRDWAWPRAEAFHPVSGVGTWADDILTERTGLGDADQDALDHVAMPLGPADVDTGRTLRRFIHRSIREHLVAQFVARLPIEQAVEALLPHLWYDPDWEYSASAAIAMHPQRDQLLRYLICHAARSHRLPRDLSVIDAGWELRGLLARIMAESGEADWSPEIASMINSARVDLVASGRLEDLGSTALWGSSNRQAIESLLGILAGPASIWAAEKLVNAVVQLSTTAADKRHARNTLLRLLPGKRDGLEGARFVGKVVGGVVRLSTTAVDKRQARTTLLGFLPGQADIRVTDELVTGVTLLSPTAQDRSQALGVLLELACSQTDGSDALWLVGRAAWLGPAEPDKRRIRDALGGLIPKQTDGRVTEGLAAWAAHLSPAAGNKHQANDLPIEMQPSQAQIHVADEQAIWVGWRAPAVEDDRQTCVTLLRSLTNATDGRTAAGQATAMICAGPTPREKRHMREVLLRLFASETNGRTAAELAGALSRLGTTAEDKRQIRGALLKLLAEQSSGAESAWLADGVIQADPSANEKRQVLDTLLRLMADQSHGLQAARLARRVSRLDPGAEDKRQTREVLLRLLADQTDGSTTQELARWVSQLDPTAEDKRRIRAVLLRLLANHEDGSLVADLLDNLLHIATTAEDKRQTRDLLLGLLASHKDGSLVDELLDNLLQLVTTGEDKRQTCDVLLDRLSAGQIGAYESAELVRAIASLAVTARDKRRGRDALLGLLAGQADGWVSSEIMAGVIRLGPTARDKRCARRALLGMLAAQPSEALSARLVDELAQLDPKASDLSGWSAWQVPPTGELLAAVRRNSKLAAWLSVLPALGPISSGSALDRLSAPLKYARIRQALVQVGDLSQRPRYLDKCPSSRRRPWNGNAPGRPRP